VPWAVLISTTSFPLRDLSFEQVGCESIQTIGIFNADRDGPCGLPRQKISIAWRIGPATRLLKHTDFLAQAFACREHNDPLLRLARSQTQSNLVDMKKSA